MGRYKTEFPGVFYRTIEGNGGRENSYYIVYKKDGKVCEEQVGRQHADGMSSSKAAGLRESRIRKLRKSPQKTGQAGRAANRKVTPLPKAARSKTSRPGPVGPKKPTRGGKKVLKKNPPVKEFRNPMEMTRLMLDHSNDAIYITQDGVTKFVNKKIEEMTGFSSDELMDQWSFELTHPDDRKVILDRYARRLRGEAVPNHYPHRIFDRRGNVIWIEVSAVMVSWEGHPAILNFVRDITKRKAAEEALKQSEQLRSDIINFLPDATFAINDKGFITAWNYAIEELTGKTSSEMIGKGDYEYARVLYGERKPILIDKAIDPSLEIAERYLSLEKEKNFLLAETELIRRGKSLTLWCKAGLMKDDGGKTIGAIESLRDISALKEMNAALDALLKKREYDLRANEEKLMRNIKELVWPYVTKLKNARLEHSLAVNVDIIEKHLHEIASPFLTQLSARDTQLSPRETQVASLIKTGMTTKEIAETLNVSTNAVDIYRQKIRKKLGLNRKKINLSSFLSAMEKR